MFCMGQPNFRSYVYKVWLRLETWPFSLYTNPTLKWNKITAVPYICNLQDFRGFFSQRRVISLYTIAPATSTKEWKAFLSWFAVNKQGFIAMLQFCRQHSKMNLLLLKRSKQVTILLVYSFFFFFFVENSCKDLNILEQALRWSGVLLTTTQQKSFPYNLCICTTVTPAWEMYDSYSCKKDN